jgi:hypothetical protein
MNYLLFAVAVALASAPAQGVVAKATKDSANEALHNWEVCSAEEYDLVTKIQKERDLLPAGTDTPEELRDQMRLALAKKEECTKLLKSANDEALRFVEGR